MPDCEPGIDDGCDIVVPGRRRPVFGSIGVDLSGLISIGRGVIPFAIDFATEPNEGHEFGPMERVVCERAMSKAEQADLLSRFLVPRYDAQDRGPVRNGDFSVVSNAFGIPGGIVTTDIDPGGLSGRNSTTPLHAFVGQITRSIGVQDGRTIITTSGSGNAGPGGDRRRARPIE